MNERYLTSDESFSDSRRLPLYQAKHSQGFGREEIDLWENPPDATSAMKQAIQHFKSKFCSDDPWDGTFTL